MSLLLTTLGGHKPTAFKLTQAINLLMAELLDRESPHRTMAVRDVVIGEDGAQKERLRFPPLWLRRLERAIEGGQFAKKSAAEIVERILTTEPPADLMGDCDERAARG
jgi:hypothetical protein